MGALVEALPRPGIAMKSKQIQTAKATDKKRAATDLARAMRFWSNLRESLVKSRGRGIALDDAKGQLAGRLVAAGSSGLKKKSPSSRSGQASRRRGRAAKR